MNSQSSVSSGILISLIIIIVTPTHIPLPFLKKKKKHSVIPIILNPLACHPPVLIGYECSYVTEKMEATNVKIQLSRASLSDNPSFRYFFQHFCSLNNFTLHLC